MKSRFTSNELKYFARGACLSVSLLYSSGTLLQTFLSANGVSSEQIGMLTAVINVVQMVTILLVSAAADRMKNPVKTSAVLLGCLPIFFVIVLPFAVMTDVSAQTLFGAVMAAAIIQNLFYGVLVVLDYRLPYEIIDMKNYAPFSSVNGIVSGLFSVLFSALTTGLISVFPFDRVIVAMYVFSAIALLAGAVMVWKMKPIRQVSEAEKEKKESGLIPTLKLPAFWILLLPNLMRGFNTGVVGMLATIGIYELGMSAAQSSALSIAYTVMSILGAACFMRLCKKIALHKLYLMASVLILASLVLLMAGKSFYVFFVVYIAVILGLMLADYSVPALVVKIIPYECIGSYTSFRMGTHTGGTALGALVAGAALGNFPVILLLAFSGLMQLGSGLVYYLFSKTNRELTE